VSCVALKPSIQWLAACGGSSSSTGSSRDGTSTQLQVQVHRPTISDANEIEQDSRKLVIVVIHT